MIPIKILEEFILDIRLHFHLYKQIIDMNNVEMSFFFIKNWISVSDDVMI